MRRLAISLLALGALSSCQPAPVVGASCMYPSDCHSPLRCRFERCRNPCTLDSECPAGTTCLLDPSGDDGSCGVSQDVGCEHGLDCDDALECVLDRCMARCRDATDCPTDAVCSIATGEIWGACFDRDAEIPDAGTRDAGSD
jgi:hypothetical protein